MSITPSLTSLIAPAIFSAGPKDIVPTVDVYTTKGGINKLFNNPLNQFSDVADGLLDSLTSTGKGILTSLASSAGLTNLSNLSSLASPGNIASLARGVVSGKLPSLSINVKSIQDRVQSAVGGQIASLGAGLGAELARSVGLNSNKFAQAILTVGNVAIQMDRNHVSDARGAAQMLNQITGNSRTASFLDVGPAASAASAVTRQLIQMGASAAIPNYYQQLPHPEIVKAAMIDSLSAAVNASDLDTILLILTNQGVGAALTKMPDLGHQLIHSYKLPATAKSTDYPTLLGKLLQIITAVDPNWDTFVRGGGTVGSLGYFGIASADALSLLRTDDTHPNHVLACTLGNTYPSTNVLDALKKLYPFMLKA